MTRLGHRLREARITLNLTLNQIAEKTGYVQSYHSRMERGTASTNYPNNVLKILSLAYELPIEELKELKNLDYELGPLVVTLTPTSFLIKALANEVDPTDGMVELLVSVRKALPFEPSEQLYALVLLEYKDSIHD